MKMREDIIRLGQNLLYGWTMHETLEEERLALTEASLSQY